jgi:hypothetical protein
LQYSLPVRSIADDRLALLIAVLGAGLAVSLFYTPLFLVVLVGVPCSIYFASRPYELLLTMVFLIPFNFVFKVGPIPVAMELLKIGIWIPFLATRHERSVFQGSFLNRWVAIVGAIVVLSLARAHDLPFTVKECIRLGSNIGLLYVCVNLVNTEAKIWQIFRVLTISGFLVALYGFYQWAIQDYGALP